MLRKNVEFFQVEVGEGQHLRQEGVEPDEVGELAAEILLLILGQLTETLYDGGKGRI